MRRLAPLLAGLTLVLGACSGGGGSSAGSASQAAGVPDELVIGFVPSSEAAQLVEDIQPLADYLTRELGIEVSGFVSNDYAAMVTAMQTGQAHIAALPPFGLVQAVDEAGAEIILQSERNGSATYHTQFFTTDVETFCADDPVENMRVIEEEEVAFLNCNGTERGPTDSPTGPIGLEALEALEPGATVSFVEQASTSGYIFPATVLLGQGIDPENDIEPLFAGSHDASVIAVCDGDAAIGVSFDDARTIATSDCDIPGTVVVFAYGDEIPNDGIAVSGDLPADLRQEIAEALIAYAETDEGAEVLEAIYQITSFTEPNIEALDIVRQAAEELGAGG